jgi:hypothetical protein
VALAIVLSAAGGFAALAQSKEDRIRELLELSQTEALIQSILPSLLQQTRSSISQLRPDIPDTVWDRTIEVAEDTFRESIAGFVEQCVPVYARNFSDEEIDGMLEFYRTPVGRSVVAKLPQVTQESMMIGQSWGNAVGQEVVRRVLETLSDEGYKI